MNRQLRQERRRSSSSNAPVALVQHLEHAHELPGAIADRRAQYLPRPVPRLVVPRPVEPLVLVRIVDAQRLAGSRATAPASPCPERATRSPTPRRRSDTRDHRPVVLRIEQEHRPPIRRRRRPAATCEDPVQQLARNPASRAARSSPRAVVRVCSPPRIMRISCAYLSSRYSSFSPPTPIAIRAAPPSSIANRLLAVRITPGNRGTPAATSSRPDADRHRAFPKTLPKGRRTRIRRNRRSLTFPTADPDLDAFARRARRHRGD